MQKHSISSNETECGVFFPYAESTWAGEVEISQPRPIYASPTLAIKSEGFAKGPYQESNLTAERLEP